MICPECGLDHEEGSPQCLTGGGDSGREVEFIPLAEVADAEAFQALALRLEEDGIPWYIQSEPRIIAGPDPGASVAMIYVAEHRFRRALRILDGVRLVGIEQKL